MPASSNKHEMSTTLGLKKVGRHWHYSLTVNGQRRHGSTRAQDLATARVVLEDQSMLGHKCITTTMIYIETGLEKKRKAEENLGKHLGLG